MNSIHSRQVTIARVISGRHHGETVLTRLLDGAARQAPNFALPPVACPPIVADTADLLSRSLPVQTPVQTDYGLSRHANRRLLYLRFTSPT